jgi:hypothetical protein
VALEILMEKGRQSHVGQSRCEGRSRPAGVALATLGFAGSWASVGEHVNQIEEEARWITTRRSKAPSHQCRRGPGAAGEELGQGGAMGGSRRFVPERKRERERERGGGSGRGLDPSQAGT